MALSKRLRATIAHEYRDSDGYWIELLPGWQNGYDPGTHGIVEDTKTAAYSTLTGVEACDCKECHELKGDLAVEKGNAFGLTEAGRAWLVKACGEEPVSGLANAFELAVFAEEDGLSVVRTEVKR